MRVFRMLAYVVDITHTPLFIGLCIVNMQCCFTVGATGHRLAFCFTSLMFLAVVLRIVCKGCFLSKLSMWLHSKSDQPEVATHRNLWAKPYLALPRYVGIPTYLLLQVASYHAISWVVSFIPS